uniref:Uncharacterized protein n=1 Tax=Nelumbo nucifera TaxID=4432 RepID=A0A822Z0F5_NELNU|nr:TPA_asm: hypothetical protein HUJ06_005598 [Nelumbo nucifera]
MAGLGFHSVLTDFSKPEPGPHKKPEARASAQDLNFPSSSLSLSPSSSSLSTSSSAFPSSIFISVHHLLDSGQRTTTGAIVTENDSVHCCFADRLLLGAGDEAGYLVPYKKDQIVFTQSSISIDVVIELILTRRTHAPPAWLPPKPNKKTKKKKRGQGKEQWEASVVYTGEKSGRTGELQETRCANVGRQEKRVGSGVVGDTGIDVGRRERRLDGGAGRGVAGEIKSAEWCRICLGREI